MLRYVLFILYTLSLYNRPISSLSPGETYSRPEERKWWRAGVFVPPRCCQSCSVPNNYNQKVDQIPGFQPSACSRCLKPKIRRSAGGAAGTNTDRVKFARYELSHHLYREIWLLSTLISQLPITGSWFLSWKAFWGWPPRPRCIINSENCAKWDVWNF